jgi:hypothetical protein
MNNSLIIYFPGVIFSGHEKMAIRIIKSLDIKLIILSNNINFFHLSDFNDFEFKPQFFLFKNLYKYNTKKILLISGSPYGLLIEKIILYLLGFKIYEYTPFPELNIMRDRFHHIFMPFINRVTIYHRFLIDDWQIEFSKVKSNSVIRNII